MQLKGFESSHFNKKNYRMIAQLLIGAIKAFNLLSNFSINYVTKHVYMNNLIEYITHFNQKSHLPHSRDTLSIYIHYKNPYTYLTNNINYYLNTLNSIFIKFNCILKKNMVE